MKNFISLLAFTAFSGAFHISACHAESILSDTGTGGGELVNPAAIVSPTVSATIARAFSTPITIKSSETSINSTIEVPLLITATDKKLRKLETDFARLFPGGAPEIIQIVAVLEKTQVAAEGAGAAFERLASSKKGITLAELNGGLNASGALRANLKELVGALKKTPRGAGLSGEQTQLLESALDTVGELTLLLEALAPALQSTRDQLVGSKKVTEFSKT